MRPSPTPRRSVVLLTLLLAACGPEPESTAASAPAATSAPAAPARVGSEEAPPRPGEPLAPLVSALAARAVVDPRPDVALAPAGAPEPYAPRLTGRTSDGEAILEFPLVHTRVIADVSGDVARVEVTQYYSNPSPDRLEAIYAFPLPPDAAVTDMLFKIGDRVVSSEVRRREEAKRIYESAKRAGRAAALTEEERPNLFTQSVANVPPGEAVAVVLRYVHQVPLEDGRYRFHFPTTVGPRYVPGAPALGAGGPGLSPDTGRVPDASRVTPPVLAAGTRASHDLDLLVRLAPGGAFDDVAAASHRIVTGLDGSGARLVALAEDDRIPDRDVVLSWRPAEAVPAVHALVQRERGEDFLVLFLQPPAEAAPAQVRPKELVFLVDKSGSMSGAPLDLARRLIGRALEAMGPDDTFQLVAFDGAAQAMTEAPLAATPSAIARAKAWLAALGGGGGTEMLEGIRAALTPPADPRRLRIVVFCTDGFIGNEAEIIAAVEALRGPARVFGFGMGSSVNRYLVEGVGRAGRGGSEIVTLRERPEEAVERLFRRIDRPVLTDLEVAFEGAEVRELLPARLPDLFAGQPLVLTARLPRGAPDHVRLRGRLGEAPYDVRLPVPAPALADATAQPVAGTLWARRRIADLLSARPHGGPERAALEETVALALRFKLVTPYTSFVAVERELRVDPALPLAQALVPNALPEGVSHEGIFGPGSEIEVLPARVKPGDPELRVEAPPSAVAVRVLLPFEAEAREAVRDPARGDFVLRFLVPSGWPEGSYDARVSVVHASGAVEERRAAIRVDTTPAALAVLSAPRTARPGEALRIVLKPALPAARAAAALLKPGGPGPALKGAMEVREVLVRTPWGAPVRARMEGPLGAWVAVVEVPEAAPEGAFALDVAAADAAGNVSRRRLSLRVTTPAPPAAPAPLEAGSGGGLALGAALLGAGALIGIRAARRPRRRAPAIGLASALEAAPVPARRGSRSGRTALLGVVPFVLLLGAAAALVGGRERARLAHLAIPIASDPSLAATPGVALGTLPPCAVEPLARVGRRITAVVPADDGTLVVGTFDDGLLRVGPDGAPRAVEGLSGRERFVNALASHEGVIWAATQGGLLGFEPDGERLRTLLPGEGVTSLARSGRALYAGTARGVFRISEGRGAEPLHVTGPYGEPLRVSALAASGAQLWIGTPSGAYALALAALDAPALARTASWHPLVFADPPAETNVVTALAPVEGGVVAGTDDGGLVRLGDEGGAAALRFDDRRANEVNPGAAAASALGAVLGTQGGGLVFARARGGALEAARPRGLEGEAISALWSGPEGLLAGTAEGALLRVACEPPRS